MKKKTGHDIRLVLKRQPGKGNAVYLDGKKLAGVTEVTVVGKARAMPVVKITLLPTALTSEIGDIAPVFYRPPKRV
jgi:hypothetical protein